MIEHKDDAANTHLEKARKNIDSGDFRRYSAVVRYNIALDDLAKSPGSGPEHSGKVKRPTTVWFTSGETLQVQVHASVNPSTELPFIASLGNVGRIRKNGCYPLHLFRISKFQSEFSQKCGETL